VEVRQFRFETREPSLTDAQRAEILQDARDFRRLYPPVGKAGSGARQAVLFGWPLRPAAHLNDPGYHGISAFVDHNPSYPNQLTDYNCGERTYDLDEGYNHAGTDFFIWPHSWNKMDNDDVEIAAAAAGTIIQRRDGHYDRNCGLNSESWNGVVVMHDDGSIAAYVHMKMGSVTAKNIHQRVEAGEYLGVVGSSGSSTGPHLHFEVWDADDNLIDPWSGPCNNLNDSSWWEDQRPYYDSAINQISTHSAPIGWGAVCPAPDTLHPADVFNPGDAIYFYAFGRDAVMGDEFSMAVFDSDNSLFFSDTYTFTEATHWPAIGFGWVQTLPVSAPTGTWRYEFYYKDQTYQQFFDVEHATAVAFTQTNAALRGNGVEVVWEVIVDEPITGFEVFRRVQGTTVDVGLTSGGLTDPATRRFLDTTVEPGTTCRYSVGAFRPDGSYVRSRRFTISVPAGKTELLPNIPNPFNPSTSIEYRLAEPMPVRIAVFDARGALVAVLVEGPAAAGRHAARWNGLAADGTPAASGVYFVRLEAGKRILTRKAVLLK
jgi:hypothetical protein